MNSKNILSLIVCPYCENHDLILKNERIFCRKCKTVYEIIQGVPVLLKQTKLNKQEYSQKKWFENHYSKFSKSLYKLENWRLSMLKRIFASVSTKNIRTYLDIGCGATGYTVIEAARQNNWTAIGVDISLEAMIRAKMLADQQKQGNKTAFIVCSAEHLPFKKELFDYVSAISLLEHLENDEQVIRNVQKIIKTNGYLYVCVPNTYKKMWFFLRPVYFFIDKNIGHLRHYAVEDLNQLMKGFKNIKCLYNAHLLKLVQLLLDKCKLIDDKNWWKIENNDLNQNPSGIQLNAFYQKKST